MKTLLAGLLLSSLALATSETVSPARKAKADPDYEALSILVKNCAACHNQADHPGAMFLNQARLNEADTLKLIKRVIEEKIMPPVHEDFKNSADGKKLISWLDGKTKKKGATK